MDPKNDDRFKSGEQPRGSDSNPVSPTDSTADNPSVYKQPPLEEATRTGKADKMDEDCHEDRKHTP